MHSITLKIDGMTCVSCENRIEKKLQSTKGVSNVKVSYSSCTAALSYDENIISINEIIKIIEQLGYKTVKSTGKKTNILTAFGAIVILPALYIIMSRHGALNIFGAFPQAKEGAGYGMLFIIGLLTSLHCVAMCGGINLSQCVPQRDKSTIAPSILYNVGRVISYTVIGGIVGVVGSVISFSGAMKGIVQIAAGVFMVIMGLNMLNIFPWLRKLNPKMPRIFAGKINEQKKSKSPLYVGLLNGLMPCGPLQAMQLFALSTGSPIKGALSMLLFSLGTVPLMFGLGAISSFLSRKFTHRILTVSAVLVVILGVSMFSGGMSLSEISIGTAAGNNAEISTKISENVQTIRTNLSPGRYEPITVQKGIPVKWIIKAEKKDLNGCNNEILIPKFNIEKKLEVGYNTIEFTPTESGTFAYSCWMGMIRSSITVVDDLGGED
ncbi:MAG: sulfite exporter TauE/SafE family protein [Monoglobales bacterium]